MRKMFVFLLSLSLLTIFGCAKRVDYEADKEALNNIIDKWGMNVMSGNVEAIVEIYIDDAVRINADGTVLVGKEAIYNAFKTHFEQYNVTKVDNKVEDIRVSGDLAVIRGSFSGTIVPKEGGEPIHSNNANVAVYQRQSDGSWKSLYMLATQIKE